MSRTRRAATTTFAALGLVLTLAVTPAWAFWSAPSGLADGTSTAATVDRGATPTAVAAGATVTVSWAASTLTSGQAVAGYLVGRYDATTLTLQTTLTACAGTVTATSCTESGVPDGRWAYTVTPRIGMHWVGAESSVSNAITVDTTPPSPGTIDYADGLQPGQSVVVSFTTGTDSGSGIATRQLQRASATLSGVACGSFSSFANLGPDGPTSPYTDSQTVNGSCYRYRYFVTDQAGNQTIATSAHVAKIDSSGGGPTLGTAGPFSVLGGTGVTSSGTTTVSGDLGVSPSTSVVGFPDGVVAGTIHAGDPAAAQAQLDLVAAYNDAASRTPSGSFAGDQIGKTFDAGVYSTAAAFALTGTMTLDGQGNPNAVFIFQINAALNTAASSTVNLINGAQASHVFWQVNGAAGTGANSSFAGTIMSNGAITLGASSQLIGRALAYGTITLANNTIRFAAALPPVVAIDGGATSVTTSPTPTITGTTNAAPGTTVAVAIAGQALSAVVQSDGAWSVTATTLTAGLHNVMASAMDAAGDTGTATQSLTVRLNPVLVALATAGTYSVLGGTGVTSSGTTTVSGDLGVSPSTSVVGFPDGVVAGTIHAGDPAAAQAQLDLVAAYNDAASRTPSGTFAGDLNGQTFDAGVYSTAAALALTGTLTLDGQGNPNAVFIFQINAALNTAAASTVNLINGAQASHVFWQVNGAAGTGATSSFSGTIMAAGAITLGAGSQLIGRALAYGTITLANNTIAIS